jgi:septal ring-binding cell division protein DamX
METLLMTPRWTDFHMDEFESQWRGLDTTVRGSAKSSSKFRQLSGRVSDNIKTHAALADLDPSSGANEKWARLQQLGKAIGIQANELPAQPHPTASDPSNAHTGARKSLPTKQATDWFSRQPRTGYTVQLFTASQPSNALRLVEQFPGLRLKVQRSDSTPHLYRVVHGSFVSSEQAEEAGEQLPVALTQVTGFPYVRAFDQLKGREIRP